MDACLTCTFFIPLKGNIETRVNGSIILTHGYNGRSIVNNTIGSANTYLGCDMISEVNCTAKSRTLEITVRLSLMYCSGGQFPMLSQRVPETKRKMAFYTTAIGVRVCACGRIGILPILKFIEQTSGSKHKAVL